MNTDIFTLHYIVSYCDIDTRCIIHTLCKSFNTIKILCDYEPKYYSPPWCKVLVNASYYGSLKIVKHELLKFADFDTIRAF